MARWSTSEWMFSKHLWTIGIPVLALITFFDVVELLYHPHALDWWYYWSGSGRLNLKVLSISIMAPCMLLILAFVKIMVPKLDLRELGR